jgi:G protein-coupled glucose receptor regulating Gpa2
MAVIYHALFPALHRGPAPGEGVEGDEYAGSGSLFPLPPMLRNGLSAITFFSFLSFLGSISLFGYLCFRLIKWRRKSPQAYNQFVVLIMNLLFADIHQSLAFLLNVQWVAGNGLDMHSPTCKAQGWLVSVGIFDLSI